MTTYASAPAENLLFNMPDYVKGFKISYVTTATITVDSGYCRDSTGCWTLYCLSTTTINSGRVGLINGLDTGTLAASTVYAVHLLNDSTGKLAPGYVISTSATAPTLPQGYDIFRRIGWAVTDGSSYFTKIIQSGTGLNRRYEYDSMPRVLNGGAATSYTAIDLSTYVPSIQDMPVSFSVVITPSVAGRYIKIRQGGSSTTVPQVISGDVAAIATYTPVNLLVGLESSLAKVDYLVANSADRASVYVQNFTDYL